MNRKFSGYSEIDCLVNYLENIFSGISVQFLELKRKIYWKEKPVIN